MKTITKLLTSRKFVALIAGLITLTLNTALDIQLREDVVLSIAAMVSAYLVGQGVADAGKEKAIVERGDGGE